MRFYPNMKHYLMRITPHTPACKASGHQGRGTHLQGREIKHKSCFTKIFLKSLFPRSSPSLLRNHLLKSAVSHTQILIVSICEKVNLSREYGEFHRSLKTVLHFPRTLRQGKALKFLHRPWDCTVRGEGSRTYLHTTHITHTNTRTLGTLSSSGTSPILTRVGQEQRVT